MAKEYKEKGYLFKFSGIVLILTSLVFILNKKYNLLNIYDDTFQIIYLVIIIILISSFFAGSDFSEKIMHLFLWASVFISFLLIYSYRYELTEIKDRVLSEVIPGREIQTEFNSATFRKSSDGHYYISIKVNSIPVLFMVDTGATGVVLSPDDGKKLGFLIDELDFNKIFYTANGKVKASRISLKSLGLNNFELNDFPAYINGAELNTSLLGMSFFQKLKRFEISKDLLTIYW